LNQGVKLVSKVRICQQKCRVNGKSVISRCFQIFGKAPHVSMMAEIGSEQVMDKNENKTSRQLDSSYTAV